MKHHQIGCAVAPVRHNLTLTSNLMAGLYTRIHQFDKAVKVLQNLCANLTNTVETNPPPHKNQGKYCFGAGADQVEKNKAIKGISNA